MAYQIIPDFYHGDALSDDAFHQIAAFQKQQGYSQPYAILKGSQGRYLDTAVVARRTAAHSIGFRLGYYDFLTTDNDQYSAFIKTLSASGDLIGIIDAETQGLTEADVTSLGTKIKLVTGRFPMLYSGFGFWVNNLNAMNDYPLWIAHYGVDTEQLIPMVEHHFGMLVMHQFSECFNYPGVENPCDASKIIRDLGGYLL